MATWFKNWPLEELYLVGRLSLVSLQICRLCSQIEVDLELWLFSTLEQYLGSRDWPLALETASISGE